MTSPARTFQGSVAFAGVLTHVASWVAMVTSGLDWVGAWKMSLDWAAGSVVISGPVAAALAAWVYSALTHSSLTVLSAGAPRAVGGWLRPAGVVLAGATLSLMALVVELCVLAVAIDVPMAPRQLGILPGCVAVLAVHVLIGAGLGRTLPLRWAAPIAGLMSFAVFILSTAGYAPDVFQTGGVTGSLVGEQYRLAAMFAIPATALALAVGLVPASIAPAVGWRTSVVVAAAALGFIVSAGVDSRSAIDLEGRLEAAPVTYVCAGAAPEVCVASETPRHLRATAERMKQLAAPLLAVHVELPPTWRESSWFAPPDPAFGALDFTPGTDTGSAVSDRDVVGALAMPADCAGYGADEPEDSVHGRYLLGAWISLRNHLGGVVDAREWLASPESEEWVRRTYRLLATCNLEAIRLPVGYDPWGVE